MKLVRAVVPAVMLVILSLSLGSAEAWAWHSEAHQAIAEFALQKLNPHARAEVKRLLGGESLATASTWPDDLRHAKQGRGPLKHSPEAAWFNRRFGNSDRWHYMNQPLEARPYRLHNPGTRRDDPVQKLVLCIETLRSRNPSTKGLQKKEALRWLVHLVGDIHQPLHVACGYYEISGGKVRLVQDPTRARTLRSDLGGNGLLLAGAYKNLHQLWDGALIDGRGDEKRRMLLRMITPWPDSPRGVNMLLWPERWATETVAEARGAYQGLTFGVAGQQGKKLQVPVALSSSYKGDNQVRVKRQLSRAGTRLAALLNAIWP